MQRKLALAVVLLPLGLAGCSLTPIQMPDNPDARGGGADQFDPTQIKKDTGLKQLPDLGGTPLHEEGGVDGSTSGRDLSTDRSTEAGITEAGVTEAGPGSDGPKLDGLPSGDATNKKDL
jgi:hypothetical protein